MARIETITCDFCQEGMLAPEIVIENMDIHRVCFEKMNAAQLVIVCTLPGTVFEMDATKHRSLISFTRDYLPHKLNENL
jgi:hypothetical protein